MIYTNSKGEQKPVSEINIFELKNAAQKADRVRNFLTGISVPHSDREEWEAVGRYVDIVRENLWAELEARNITGIDDEFEAEFGHLNDSEKTALKNFIRNHFTLKKDV